MAKNKNKNNGAGESPKSDEQLTQPVPEGQGTTAPETTSAVSAASAEAVGSPEGEAEAKKRKQAEWRKNPVSEITPYVRITIKSRDAEGNVINPKRAGSASAEAFAKYSEGQTVAEYFKACEGLSRKVGADFLRWDERHGFIGFYVDGELKAAYEAEQAQKAAEAEAAKKAKAEADAKAAAELAAQQNSVTTETQAPAQAQA
jgi:hypothetical protein